MSSCSRAGEKGSLGLQENDADEWKSKQQSQKVTILQLIKDIHLSSKLLTVTELVLISITSDGSSGISQFESNSSSSSAATQRSDF